MGSCCASCQDGGTCQGPGFVALAQAHDDLEEAADGEPQGMVIWGPMSVEVPSRDQKLVRLDALEEALPQLLRRGVFSVGHEDTIVGKIKPVTEADPTDLPTDTLADLLPDEVSVDDVRRVVTRMQDEHGGLPTGMVTVTEDIARVFPRLQSVVGDAIPFVGGQLFRDNKLQDIVEAEIEEGILDGLSISGLTLESGYLEWCDPTGCQVLHEVEDFDFSAVTLAPSKGQESTLAGDKQTMNPGATFLPIQQAQADDDEDDDGDEVDTRNRGVYARVVDQLAESPDAHVLIPGVEGRSIRLVRRSDDADAVDAILVRDLAEGRVLPDELAQADGPVALVNGDGDSILVEAMRGDDGQLHAAEPLQQPLTGRGLEFPDFDACLAWAEDKEGITDPEAFCGSLEEASSEDNSMTSTDTEPTQQAHVLDQGVIEAAVDALADHDASDIQPVYEADVGPYHFAVFEDGDVQARAGQRTIDLPDAVAQRLSDVLQGMEQEHVFVDWSPPDDVDGEEPGEPLDVAQAGDDVAFDLQQGTVRPVRQGDSLSNVLKGAIAERLDDTDEDEEDVLGEVAEKAGMDQSTVDAIAEGRIVCPPRERLSAFAEELDVSMDDLVSAWEDDGCASDDDQAGVVDEGKAQEGEADVSQSGDETVGSDDDGTDDGEAEQQADTEPEEEEQAGDAEQEQEAGESEPVVELQRRQEAAEEELAEMKEMLANAIGEADDEDDEDEEQEAGEVDDEDEDDEEQAGPSIDLHLAAEEGDDEAIREAGLDPETVYALREAGADLDTVKLQQAAGGTVDAPGQSPSSPDEPLTGTADDEDVDVTEIDVDQYDSIHDVPDDTLDKLQQAARNGDPIAQEQVHKLMSGGIA